MSCWFYFHLCEAKPIPRTCQAVCMLPWCLSTDTWVITFSCSLSNLSFGSLWLSPVESLPLLLGQLCGSPSTDITPICFFFHLYPETFSKTSWPLSFIRRTDKITLCTLGPFPITAKALWLLLVWSCSLLALSLGFTGRAVLGSGQRPG